MVEGRTAVEGGAFGRVVKIIIPHKKVIVMFVMVVLAKCIGFLDKNYAGSNRW